MKQTRKCNILKFEYLKQTRSKFSCSFQILKLQDVTFWSLFHTLFVKATQCYYVFWKRYR